MLINEDLIILREIKSIIGDESNNNSENISLHDIWTISNQRNKQLQQLQLQYQKQMLKLINKKISKSADIELHDFNYYKNELTISFQWYELKGTITFSKKDNHMYIKETNCPIENKILITMEDILSKLYDEYIKYCTFQDQDKYSIKSINSSFIIDITQNYIIIQNNNLLQPNFKIKKVTEDNKYIYYYNSNNMFALIKDNKSEIFKRIFVKINDCPNWMQEELHKLRAKQLQKEKANVKTKILSIFK